MKEPEGKLITCRFCGSPGYGGLRKDKETGEYFCNKRQMCQEAVAEKQAILKLAKKPRQRRKS